LSFWRERRVFVTGGSGLLGSWLVDALLAAGANVTCLIRDWVPASRLVTTGAIRRTNLVTGSLESYDVLLRALNEYEIDTVFHLAAQTIVGTASRSALSTFESNIRGTWNLLEACRACSKLVQRVVMASSDKAYGAQRNLPYTEDMPLEGRFPYDVSKSCADLLAQSYFHTYRTPVAITRCANLFGGGDLSFNRLVPGTILSALRDQPPLIRSNGQLIRDYIDVQSAVAGYLQLAERMPEDAVVGQAFNFGYGEPVSVLELVQTILALMGKAALSPVVLNQAEHEIEEQYLDSSKAQRVLGWRPSHSREEALRETIQWYERYDAGAATPSSPHIPLAT
jgi:CDP-glucose 4,6-dehydratase